ncbi:MAG: hypothetical protein Q7R41_19755 [Phycisphaerales bacterium]|jgi:hypothetical protein|nr:hypothetical protein [Phycisphaerales bacterium]
MDHFGGNNASGLTGDPFSKFWMDCLTKMASAGFAPPPSSTTESSEEAVKQMRRAFFDSWAQHCEEFMRSPAFLEGMKRAMDSSLAFREQLNEFMTRALHEGQIPARSDTDSILVVLRSLEDRVLDRLDRLEKRVASMNGTQGGGPSEERAPAGAGTAAGTTAGSARRGKGGQR